MSSSTQRSATSDRRDQLEQRRIHQRHNRLGLRIPEAGIEFDDLWPVIRDHEPGVEQTLE